LLLPFVALCVGPLTARAQFLETETARPPRAGAAQVGAAFEYQTSSEGRETALPLAFEYSLTHRLELLVEPVPSTRILPHVGPHASGPGDLEVTLQQLLRPEIGGWPALALAGELKIPTAKNVLIGTGRTDYAIFAIASRRIGAMDTHANVGYNILGRPAGVSLQNTISAALAAEYRVARRLQLFGEVLGNTSATGESKGGDAAGAAATTPEVAGGELVGTLGFAFSPTPSFDLSFGVSRDNNDATLFRPGITYRFR
jgi:hypothetical protein